MPALELPNGGSEPERKPHGKVGFSLPAKPKQQLVVVPAADEGQVMSEQLDELIAHRAE
jgi:hypothetical protein